MVDYETVATLSTARAQLAAVDGPLRAHPAIAQGAQKLTDHFGRPQHSGVNLGTASCGAVWYGNGKMVVDEGAAVREAYTAPCYCYLDSLFDTVRATVVVDTPTSGDTDFGVLFRCDDSANFLYAYACNSLGVVRIGKRASSTYTENIASASVAVDLNTRHTLTVESVDDDITVYLNGVSVLTHTLSEGDHAAFTGTNVGIIAHHTRDNYSRFLSFEAEPIRPHRPILEDVLAHRGMVRGWPENSVRSLTALPASFTGVEIDARQTADDVWIMSHDGTMDRTTNGTGSIWALDSDYVLSSTIDGGGGYVPTLAEYLNVLATLPHLRTIYLHDIGEGDPASLIAHVNASAVAANVVYYCNDIDQAEAYRAVDANVRLSVINVTPANAADVIPRAVAIDVESCIVGNAGDASYLANNSIADDIIAAGMKAGGAVIERASTIRQLVADGCTFVVSQYGHLFSGRTVGA